MEHKARSIRTFIGAKNFEESRTFYKELGFREVVISDEMSYFEAFSRIKGELGFYLQKYYVEQWVNNSMIFLEVDNVDRYWEELNARVEKDAEEQKERDKADKEKRREDILFFQKWPTKYRCNLFF